jgi:hypothetical protein
MKKLTFDSDWKYIIAEKWTMLRTVRYCFLTLKILNTVLSITWSMKTIFIPEMEIGSSGEEYPEIQWSSFDKFLTFTGIVLNLLEFVLYLMMNRAGGNEQNTVSKRNFRNWFWKDGDLNANFYFSILQALMLVALVFLHGTGSLNDAFGKYVYFTFCCVILSINLVRNFLLYTYT